MNTYRPNEFAKLIAKTTNTLQRWDREGILKAHRTPSFSYRLYGLRRYKEMIKDAVSENTDSV